MLNGVEEAEIEKNRKRRESNCDEYPRESMANKFSVN
jgi:hypothetical protein